jgi:hypothetical protein
MRPFPSGDPELPFIPVNGLFAKNVAGTIA